MIEMNKAILPSILAATILIAGLFALAPIEKASTVHGTIQGNQLNQIVIATSNNLLTTAANARCTDNIFIVYYVISGPDASTITINPGDDNIIELFVTFEDSGGNAGSGINMATGVVSASANEILAFGAGAGTPTGIFTIVGQSDDTCSFT